MAISSAGVGSGLDVASIVSQLMEIERAPIDRLDTKQTLVESQISAYGSLKSKVSTFQSAMEDLSSLSKFQVFSATSNNEALFTAKADSEAAAGSYDVTVTQVAKRDKIATNAFTDTNTAVGLGTLTISVGVNSFDVTVDGTNNTVAQLRDSINNAADNTGVTASIITDDAGAHLVLSSNDTGEENALTVSTVDTDGNNTDDAGLSSLAYDVGGGVVHRAAISTAADAIVEIDGFSFTSASNTISGAVQGLSITVKELGSSTIDIARDDEAITETVQAFADAYNALRTELTNQHKKGGTLEADSTILSIERQMAGILNSGDAVTGSTFSYLSQVGLTSDDSGQLSLDSDVLTSVLESDFDSVANLFAAQDEGIAFRLENFAAGLLKTNDGLLDIREKGLNTRLDGIEDQKIHLEDRMVNIERRIRAQFTVLDTLVSELSSQGNFLTQQLSALSGSK